MRRPLLTLLCVGSLTAVHAQCLQGNCEAGWCSLGEGTSQRCMKIFDEPQTWQGACAACAEKGSQLLTIRDAWEQIAVEATLSGANMIGREFLFGLYRPNADGQTVNGEWLWQSGDEVSYTDDFTHQGELEHCGVFHGRWHSTDCSKTHGAYACETATSPAQCPMIPTCWPGNCGAGWCSLDEYQVTPRCIRIFDEPQTWQGACAACAEKGLQLLTIRNDWEQSVVERAFSDRDFHIGLYRPYADGQRVDGEWQWQSGAEVSYTHFGGVGAESDWEHCNVFWHDRRWHSTNCSKVHGAYACETAPSLAECPIFPTTSTTTCLRGSCEAGWCSLGEGTSQRCMRKFDEPQTWQGACAACAAKGSQLLTIGNALEQATVESAFGGPDFHIGLYRPYANGEFVDGEWQWQSGNEVSFTHFGGEHAETNWEHCSVFSYDRRWHATRCSKAHGAYACETTPLPAQCPDVPTTSTTTCYQGSCEAGWCWLEPRCIRRFDELQTWHSACAACAEKGSQLLTIRNGWEHGQVERVLGGRDFFIGLYRPSEDGLWQWQIGPEHFSEVGYLDELWVEGDGEHCGVFGRGGSLHTTRCTKVHQAYACETATSPDGPDQCPAGSTVINTDCEENVLSGLLALADVNTSSSSYEFSLVAAIAEALNTSVQCVRLLPAISNARRLSAGTVQQPVLVGVAPGTTPMQVSIALNNPSFTSSVCSTAGGPSCTVSAAASTTVTTTSTTGTTSTTTCLQGNCEAGWCSLGEGTSQRCMRRFDEPQTWQGACAACAEKGSQLLTIRNALEQATVESALCFGDRFRPFYIGLYRPYADGEFVHGFSGEWQWQSGDAVSYTLLGDVSDWEHCSVVQDDGYWHPTTCSKVHGAYACESVPAPAECPAPVSRTSSMSSTTAATSTASTTQVALTTAIGGATSTTGATATSGITSTTRATSATGSTSRSGAASTNGAASTSGTASTSGATGTNGTSSTSGTTDLTRVAGSTTSTTTCLQGNCEAGWCPLGEGTSQRCMRIFDEPQTWQGACAACAERGSQLLTISNAWEQATVEEALGVHIGREFLIGLYRPYGDGQTVDREWQWQSGAGVSYIEGFTGESDSEHCSVWWRDGRWHSTRCSEVLGAYACETATSPAECPMMPASNTTSTTTCSQVNCTTGFDMDLYRPSVISDAGKLSISMLPVLIQCVSAFWSLIALQC